MERPNQILLGPLPMWLSSQGRSKCIIHVIGFRSWQEEMKKKEKRGAREGARAGFYSLFWASKSNSNMLKTGLNPGEWRDRLLDLLIHIHEIHSNYKWFLTLSVPTAIARTPLITCLFCNQIQLSRTNYLTQDILSMEESDQLL